jgi:phosphatidylglycerophosphate synthase
MTTERPTLAATRKQRPSCEVVSELIFRPLAHLVVLVLAPLRVPPPAVVVVGTAIGLGAAGVIWSGNLILAAVLLQVKTVLDNADGQLARATGQVTVFGRYLDSESDLLVNGFVFAALGSATGRWWLAAVAFVVVTLVLSTDFELRLLYLRERGEPRESRPAATGAAAAVLGRVYDVVYAPQDRFVEWFVERRLRGASPKARLAYHDRATLTVTAQFEFSSQFLALGICLAIGRPELYLWFVVACGLSLIPLELRRERLARA